MFCAIPPCIFISYHLMIYFIHDKFDMSSCKLSSKDKLTWAQARRELIEWMLKWDMCFAMTVVVDEAADEKAPNSNVFVPFRLQPWESQWKYDNLMKIGQIPYEPWNRPESLFSDSDSESRSAATTVLPQPEERPEKRRRI